MPRTPSKRGGGRKSSAPDKASKPAGPARSGKAGKAAKSSLPPWMPDAMSNGPAPRRAPPAARPASTGGRHHDPYADREASRYARPIASREAILDLLDSADGPQTAESIAGQLALHDPEQRDALGKRLGAMVRDGQVLQNRRGGYVPAERLALVPGTVIANPDGYGVLRPDSGSGDDLFLPPAEMRKAMHGDRVMASVTGVDRRGRREGVIVEVLERRLNRLIGRFTVESGISFVVPDDRRIQRNVQIPQDARLGANHGQLVVCEITTPADDRRP